MKRIIPAFLYLCKCKMKHCFLLRSEDCIVMETSVCITAIPLRQVIKSKEGPAKVLSRATHSADRLVFVPAHHSCTTNDLGDTVTSSHRHIARATPRQNLPEATASFHRSILFAFRCEVFGGTTSSGRICGRDGSRSWQRVRVGGPTPEGRLGKAESPFRSLLTGRIANGPVRARHCLILQARGGRGRATAGIKLVARQL